MRESALKRKLARPQMQQMMRVHDVAAVFVHCRVTYRVTGHADTARRSKSMCEKCCDVSCSESCAETAINSLRLCDRMRRSAGGLSNSPSGFAYLSATRFEIAA